MKALDVWGVRTQSGTVSDAANAVRSRVRLGAGGFVCLCNVHVLVTARRNQELSRALDEACLVFADGAPLYWAQRRSSPNCERVSGAELLRALSAPGGNLRHALFGSTPERLSQVETELRRINPQLTIVAKIAPPVGDVSMLGGEWLEQVVKARPDVIWCSLGAPKQELWMERYAPAYAPAVAIGIGAAFDFVAGDKRRAPRWMQRAGLEWMHRWAQEPRRLTGRYLVTNARFASIVASNSLRRGFGPKRNSAVRK